MPNVTVNGIEMWYEFQGRGEIIAQIHGAGFGHDNFALVTPYLAEHFRLLNYDMRGYGLTERPLQKYTMEVWADDLAGLMDKLKVPKAHIHGTSMGGMIALQFAAKYPEKTQSLIVGASGCKCDYSMKLMFEAWKEMAERGGMGDETLAKTLAIQGLTRQFLDTPKGPETVKKIREVLERNNHVEVFKSACDAMIALDLTKDIRRIKAPTLVMSGSADIMTPVNQGPKGAGSRVIAEKIPKAEFKIIKGVGHTFLFEKPEESARIIISFLKSLTKKKKR